MRITIPPAILFSSHLIHLSKFPRQQNIEIPNKELPRTCFLAAELLVSSSNTILKKLELFSYSIEATAVVIAK
jgi:hypothetical protein